MLFYRNKFKICIFLKIALLFYLSGCASFPSNISPFSHPIDPNQLNVGSAIKSAAKQPASWPTSQWWKEYNDPQLDYLVAATTAGNPTMRMAQARITKVRALSGIAKSFLFPSIQGNTVLTREQFTENQFIPPPDAGNWAWNNMATIDLSYELDLWGKNRSALAAAIDYVQVATAEAQEVRLALETSVVRVYMQLALQFELKDITL